MGLRACTEPQYSTAILLKRLCAFQNLHNIRASAIHLKPYTTYEPYGLYMASVPVEYNYTSTLPMVRTSFICPQYLYNTAIKLQTLWIV